MNESDWIERAQSAEAKLATMQESMKSAVERVKQFKTNFGIREKSDGTIIIDFEKFARNLGVTGALELRKVIDEIYNISGEPGKKPHIKVANG